MLQALPATQSLIDRAYQQLLEAIADGTLLPGQRIRQLRERPRRLDAGRPPANDDVVERRARVLGAEIICACESKLCERASIRP